MYLVDTDERLLKHIKGWLSEAEEKLKEVMEKKSGVADQIFAASRLMAMEECVDLVKEHVEQSYKEYE